MPPLTTKQLHRDYDIHDTVHGAPAILTVSEVVTLAKAGVTIDFNAIKHQIRSDPIQHNYEPRTLTESFFDRWRRANPIRALDFEGRLPPFNVFATEHGDKVHVFVCNCGTDPFILTDDRALYPSDALMAKLALFEKTQVK